MPAQLTAVEMGAPNLCSAVWSAFFTSFSDVTCEWIVFVGAMRRAWFFLTSVRTKPQFDSPSLSTTWLPSWMSATITFPPLRTIRLAAARPRPEAAPVTRAITGLDITKNATDSALGLVFGADTRVGGARGGVTSVSLT